MHIEKIQGNGVWYMLMSPGLRRLRQESYKLKIKIEKSIKSITVIGLLHKGMAIMLSTIFIFRERNKCGTMSDWGGRSLSKCIHMCLVFKGFPSREKCVLIVKSSYNSEYFRE